MKSGFVETTANDILKIRKQAKNYEAKFFWLAP